MSTPPAGPGTPSASSVVIAKSVPSLATLVLGLMGGVLQILNFAVIPVSTQIHATIATALLALASLGIPPLVGPKFRAALHLPPWASYLASAVMAILMLVLTSMQGINPTVHAVIAIIITVLSALGFSTSVIHVIP